MYLRLRMQTEVIVVLKYLFYVRLKMIDNEAIEHIALNITKNGG